MLILQGARMILTRCFLWTRAAIYTNTGEIHRGAQQILKIAAGCHYPNTARVFEFFLSILEQ